jgi:hypothetical protein
LLSLWYSCTQRMYGVVRVLMRITATVAACLMVASLIFIISAYVSSDCSILAGTKMTDLELIHMTLNREVDIVSADAEAQTTMREAVWCGVVVVHHKSGNPTHGEGRELSVCCIFHRGTDDWLTRSVYGIRWVNCENMSEKAVRYEIDYRIDLCGHIFRHISIYDN